MVDKEQMENLYHAVNRMMMTLGANGEITATSNEAGDVMAALESIDGGVYNEMINFNEADELINILEIK